MHRDVAKEIFKLDEVSKYQRYQAKNGFVFPQFYGSYYRECAKNIWEGMDEETFFHLRKQGLDTYRQFENHVCDVEYRFWNERFKVYNQWKEDSWKEYQQKGYIDSLTGFRYRGVFRKNEVLNYPIQGTAFHCLLWSLIELQHHLNEAKYITKIIGQIHDSIIFDVDPEEWKEGGLSVAIRDIMCTSVRKHWPWIIVPLDIEVEASEIDGNWYEKKVIEI